MARRPFRSLASVLIGLLIYIPNAGCGAVARFTADLVQDGDRKKGVTYYVGGAGPIGNIGFLSVPRGMKEAGYAGYVEIFDWQSVTAAIDQVALERNRNKAVDLSVKIRRQVRFHPDVPVNIVALSAGTGIAAFALEMLPEDVKINNVVFLASSLSSRYDLTRALRRVRGAAYAFHSPDDPVLRTLVPLTGTVDRRGAEAGVAGLEGFRLPRGGAPDMREQYEKLHNVPYRREFNRYGYSGGHTDCTRREFVARYIAPLLMRSIDGISERRRPDRISRMDGPMESPTQR
ncbi:MAG: hypothetical protein HUU22_17010 [Phycisphaerae bacterium]|nr:hypothetical protein [Phycisphaerae bacterium]NUQ47722.1 hypothetical protein [Phycisphaerae bacterium]